MILTEEQNLINIVKSLTGIELSPENDHLITKRLTALKDYFKIARLTEVEVQEISNDSSSRSAAISIVTNNETAFLRDVLPFKFLVDVVQNAQGEINMLSIPASTGQEPYSIAMTLQENSLKHKLIRIDAMDIDKEALEHSLKNGYFKFDLQRGLNEKQISENFELRNNRYFPKEKVLEKINFKTFNILNENLPKYEYDIVFLRNLLIYFDNADKERSVNNVVESLKDGGVIVLGNGERTHHMALREMFWHGLRYYIKE